MSRVTTKSFSRADNKIVGKVRTVKKKKERVLRDTLANNATFDTFEYCKILQEELYTAGADFGGYRSELWSEVSKDTGVSYHTIEKLALGATKYPRHSSIIVLLWYFGHDLKRTRRRRK